MDLVLEDLGMVLPMTTRKICGWVRYEIQVGVCRTE
jgi:hypothetical protein